MKQQHIYNRRDFLRSGMALAGAGLLQACSSQQKNTIQTSPTSTMNTPKLATKNENLLRIFASSGYGNSSSRSQLALQRLVQAGFLITNQEACFRRFQRFAGSDAERVADLQDVANGRVATPKVLMGLRGGYGAMRLVPSIDWSRLGARMREQGTLLFGYSDVTAIQLALLAKSKMCSFAGPMLYSEFGVLSLSTYTMQSFISNSTNNNIIVNVGEVQNQSVQAEGILWGGNLSILAALAGSDYLPNIKGGILFIEDVGEQPYRLERMLQTLYLSGVLSNQQAIIMGHFRMGTIHDVYDSSYTLNSVIQTLSRLAKIPVLTGFPFGHITNKITFPLGAMAKINNTSDGGYQISFSGYPILDKAFLSLDNLLPPPPVVNNPLVDTSVDEDKSLAEPDTNNE